MSAICDPVGLSNENMSAVKCTHMVHAKPVKVWRRLCQGVCEASRPDIKFQMRRLQKRVGGVTGV